MDKEAHLFVSNIEKEIVMMKKSQDEVCTKVSSNIKCNNVLEVVLFSLTCILFLLNSVVRGRSW